MRIVFYVGTQFEWFRYDGCRIVLGGTLKPALTLFIVDDGSATRSAHNKKTNALEQSNNISFATKK